MELSGIISTAMPMAHEMPSQQSPMATEIAKDTAPTESTPQEAAQPVEKSKHDLKYAQQFNQLARRERINNMKEKELKDKEREMKEMEEKYRPLSTLKERARKEPINVLQDLGLSYDDVTNSILNDNKPTTDMTLAELKDEIKALREEREMEKKQIKERETKDISDKYRNYLREHVTGKDEYELIAANGDEAIDLICNTMREYYHKYEKVLSEDEACKLVEDYLESESARFFKLKKIQAKFGLQTTSDKDAPAEQATQEATASHGLAPKTLTNHMSPRTTESASLIRDEAQSLKQASAVMRWTK